MCGVLCGLYVGRSFFNEQQFGGCIQRLTVTVIQELDLCSLAIETAGHPFRHFLLRCTMVLSFPAQLLCKIFTLSKQC